MNNQGILELEAPLEITSLIYRLGCPGMDLVMEWDREPRLLILGNLFIIHDILLELFVSKLFLFTTIDYVLQL